MKLYRILFDGQPQFVEAASITGAVTVWRAWAKQEWGTDYDGTEEPDSIELIHDEDVLRADDFDVNVCEGCGRPASMSDSEGVPLCGMCAAHLAVSDAETQEREGRGCSS